MGDKQEKSISPTGISVTWHLVKTSQERIKSDLKVTFSKLDFRKNLRNMVTSWAKFMHDSILLADLLD